DALKKELRGPLFKKTPKASVTKAVSTKGEQPVTATKKETGNAPLPDFYTEEAVYFDRAGLIILHPFLGTLFKNLGFLEGKNIIPKKIDRAVHTLYYLATGKGRPYEHELTFEKFMCNIPFSFPVKKNIRLTKNEKDECNALLASCLSHWPALKTENKSVLQYEFIARSGKLISANEKQKLIVERKTQDLLLQKLPYNLNLVKLPWHKKIIFVEW
ncbi:MAG: contractile injection system tape measure protein, partial [Marinirhabdus sp.]